MCWRQAKDIFLNFFAIMTFFPKGGIGGGGVFVPTYILVSGLSAHFAIPLSKVTVLGGALGSYLVNGRQRHPLTDRPLIYYDVAMMMQPTTLLGTVLGVYLNVVFPAFVLVFMLVAILIISFLSILRKAIQQRKKEKEEASVTQIRDESHDSPDETNDYMLLDEEEPSSVPPAPKFINDSPVTFSHQNDYTQKITKRTTGKVKRAARDPFQGGEDLSLGETARGAF